MPTATLVITIICIILASIVIEQVIKKTRATIVKETADPLVFEPDATKKKVLCRSRDGRLMVAKIEGTFIPSSTERPLVLLRRPRHKQEFWRRCNTTAAA